MRVSRFRQSLALSIAFLQVVAVAPASARTLRLFAVGNSFSNNATHYLPELAKSGGHELILGRAQAGGCSLERHWNAVVANLADPSDPKGKIYGGKSLAEQLGDGTWDIITMQQYSLLSANVATYRPFAANLHAHLKQKQPQAEIVVHQTWAYRSDASKFAQTGKGTAAADQEEMYRKSRAAYLQIASELGARVIPTGDAFWRVDSDPAWRYRPDASFDATKAKSPELPDQTHSLHVGYRWVDGKLGKDANHANVAGEYLGALVWYAVLFDESPERLTFVPPGLQPEFAAHLRKVAWETVQAAPSRNPKPAGVPKP